ncbi:MAG TPA: hypothetical protein VMB46_00350, partial [Methanomassiliicoccales archaeon]|nr:hypothetical protein [Methanomassiliicoccales archaeon]
FSLNQTSTNQSLARRMAIDSSDLKVSYWNDRTPPILVWNLTGQNSHIDFVIQNSQVQADISLTVWNSSASASATLNSWVDANFTRSNLTIGDESYLRNGSFGSQYSLEVCFRRGNVTVSIFSSGFALSASDWSCDYDAMFFLAIAQDAKIREVQNSLVIR